MFPEVHESDHAIDMHVGEKTGQKNLIDRIRSQPITESQQHKLPSQVKKYLRDGRWCQLNSEYFEIFRYDETALFFRKNGAQYEKLSISARSKHSIAFAFILYKPVEPVRCQASSTHVVGYSGRLQGNSEVAPAKHPTRRPFSGPVARPKSTPAHINREPWLSIRSPKPNEQVHISADPTTRSELLSRKFKPVTLKPGQTAMVIAQQYYGKADPNLIYQFNDGFSKTYPPAPGNVVDVQDGWELNMDISSRHVSSVNVSWTGPIRGSQKFPVKMSEDPFSDPVITTVKLPVSAGDYRVTVTGGGISQTSHITISEDHSPTDWLKIQAHFDDPWQTAMPLEGVNLLVDGVLVKRKLRLNKGEGTSSIAQNIEEAESSGAEPGTLFLPELPVGDVELKVQMEGVSEQEIANDTDVLIMTLDSNYRQVVRNMGEFQEQWDTYGYLSIVLNGADGLQQGAVSWFKEQATLFEVEAWSTLGRSIGDMSSFVYDYAASYSSESYKKLRQTANYAVKTIENEHVFSNWTWWQAQSDEVIANARKVAQEHFETIESAYDNAVDSIATSSYRIRQLIKHQEAILNFPSLIASNDVAGIELFVDQVVADIDPELADSIRNSPNFHITLALIADDDVVLTYLAYCTLTFEAIPPNFYSFIAGKGGAYIAIEILLLVLLSLLTLGAGTAAKLTAIAARISAKSATVANAGRRLKNAKQAITSFTNSIEEIADASKQLRSLGEKLSKARSKNTLVKGKSGSTLTHKKETVKREPKCTVCGKTGHSTPRNLKGTIQYE